MNNVLVSVVMPCYKAEKTLEKSVTGVLNQTHSALELLLVLDGMGDATWELATRLASKDPRVRVIASRKNRGVSRIRNLGIRLSKGDWIAFCDADDWWVENKLTCQLELASTKGANLVCSAFYFYYPETQKNFRGTNPKGYHLSYFITYQCHSVEYGNVSLGWAAKALFSCDAVALYS